MSEQNLPQASAPRGRGSKKDVLPDNAKAFLAQLATTRRPSTQNEHRLRLQRFHRWLHEHCNGLPVERVARADMMRWMQYQQTHGLTAMTRQGTLFTVRMYLCHLAEQGLLRDAPDALIRRSDIPKLPRYLPRPLPPLVDQEIQRRLHASSSPLQWGLLLMRNTGLRIGELRSLPFDCLRTDERSRYFLKVPIGKLNSERLVPVDEKTRTIISRIQRSGSGARKWLVQAVQDRQTSTHRLRCALAIASAGIETPEPITSHRLRHTYATVLLNAGMSVTSVMRLLGHRDIRMTMRYAAVTMETVGHQYFDALQAIERRYRCGIHEPPSELIALDPLQALADVIRLVKRMVPTLEAAAQKRARLLLRRFDRLHADLLAIAPKRDER